MGLIWKQSNMLLTNYNKKKIKRTCYMYKWGLGYWSTHGPSALHNCPSTLVAALSQCSYIFLYRLSLIPFHPQSSVLNITR